MYVSSLLFRSVADQLRVVDSTLYATLIADAGIGPSTLADPSARVPLDVADRFVQRAIELSGDPGLGLTVAASTPLGAHTLIYHLVLSCRTLREAFKVYQRIASRLVEHSEWTLSEERDTARCCYRGPLPLGDTSRFAADVTLAFAYRLAKHFLRATERPSRVSFRHSRPSYYQRYEALFGCPVDFGAPHNAIEFSRDYLDQAAIAGGNDAVRASIEQSAARVLARRADDQPISERIRAFLKSQIDLEGATSDAIAKRMAISERTLRRRLRTEGVSLLGVIDAVRKDIACEELMRRDACIGATATRLGYSDRTAFCRAFKRWTGESPRSYQRRHARQIQPAMEAPMTRRWPLTSPPVSAKQVDMGKLHVATPAKHKTS